MLLTGSQVGDTLNAVQSERQARAMIEKRLSEESAASSAARAVNLTNLFDQVSAGEVKELNVILKTDVQGSIEPIRSSLAELGTDEVKVRVIHSGTGNITENDIMLAIASKGIVVGFNTITETGAQRLAEKEGISIRHYDVIYNLVDDVDKALKGLLEPTIVEVIDGRAEVRQVFSSGKRERVAGSYITEGRAPRGQRVRVIRKGNIVTDSTVSSLRRFKDDVREVTMGYECGIGVNNFNDFEEGDILEFYRTQQAA